LSTISSPCLDLYQEERPWGTFTVLQDLPHYKLKRLQVKAGQRLSLQLHHHRAEHWIVTQGQAEVTVGERTWVAEVGEHIHIPLEMKHRLANPSTVELEILEVQQGISFAEDDIVRFEDDYSRS
jgi:mannose-6-phosphate isomerase-like protein (cupin superfamily)